MPLGNQFRHQIYSSQPPTSGYVLLAPEFPNQPASDGFHEVVADFSKRVSGKIDAIYLIHGTFAGTDSLGWVAQLDKVWPAASAKLRDLNKNVFDMVAKDSGNYTESFATELEAAIVSVRSSVDPKLPVRLFNWSSENTHCGRARAAIEFLVAMLERLENEQRIQLWCHSHAGNVLALVSNLLGSDTATREAFFQIVAPMFANGEVEKIQLAFEQRRFDGLHLDIVTFGTPIRYGWETRGYRKLLHFVNHVARDDSEEYLAGFPALRPDSLTGNQGDFVHQLGIAGTDFLPYILDFALMRAERSLSEFLAPELGRKEVLERIKIGMRVADEGTTLLIDYDNYDGLAKEAAGHGIYTMREWAAFHLKEIGKRLY